MTARSEAAARVLAAIVAGIALVVLFGWLVGLDQVVSFGSGLPSQQPSVAAGFVLLASTLWTSSSRVVVGAAVLVAVLCGVAILENAALTAGCLSLLAGARVLLALGRTSWVPTICAVTATVGSLTVLGFGYGMSELDAVEPISTMAPQSALCTVVLAIALWMLVSNSLARQVLEGGTVASEMLRRLVPVVLIGLPALGWIRLQSSLQERQDERFIQATSVLVTILVFALTVRSAAKRMNLVDNDRKAALESLRETNEVLQQGRDQAWRRADELSAHLAAERGRFQRAIANVNDFVWSAEMTDRGTELVYASPNGRGLFGGELPQVDDLAGVLRSLIHPEDLPRLREFARGVRPNEIVEQELRLIGFDGQTRWIWVRGMAREEGGRRFFDGISTNITERRELAEDRERLLSVERAHRERLEDLDRRKDEFLAMASHELRTPLTVVNGFVEMLAAEDLPADAAEQVAIIHRRTAQLVELTNQLFDLARLDAGRASLSRRRLDLGALVSEAVADQSLQARRMEIDLDTTITAGVVDGDPQRLNQILDNLLENALKYTSAGGRVHVTVRAEPDAVILEVSDTGIGIAVAELPRLFDQFFRATTALDSGIPGTGLGLAISRAIAEAHDGSLEAVSEPGRGSTFTLTLPRDPTEDPVPVETGQRTSSTTSAVPAPASGLTRTVNTLPGVARGTRRL